jgi:hypothetical protein
LKNTNLPKNRDSPVLRLITSDGFSASAFTILLLLLLVRVGVVVALSLVVGRGLRPWKEMLDGVMWLKPPPLWMVGEKAGVEYRVEEEAISDFLEEESEVSNWICRLLRYMCWSRR